MVRQVIIYLIAWLTAFCFHAEGQQVRLIKLAELQSRIQNGKDTTYIINYWATWCAPCLKELPYFDKLQKQEQRHPVKVLLVSLDFKSQYQKSVLPFAKKRQFFSEVFLLDEKDQQAYIDLIDSTWSGSLPATQFYNNKTGKYAFFEMEFSWEDLLLTFSKIQENEPAVLN